MRLPGFDYAGGGAYFVTLVTHRRRCILGQVVGNEVELTSIGRIVAGELGITPLMRPEFSFDACVIMPNHVHAIIVVDASVQRLSASHAHPALHNRPKGPRRGSIGAMIAGLKSVVTKAANIYHVHPSHPIWQRNYYEHIIRDERDLLAIRTYIESNPATWRDDVENPDRE